MGQTPVLKLLEELVKRDYRVSLETGGGVSVKEVPEKVVKVIDVKCPDSGETENMCWENLRLTSAKDQFKFVVASKTDFDWARELCEKDQLSKRSSVLFSPVQGEVKPEDLASWLLESGLDATYQLQLHKVIWGDRRGV